MNRISRFCLLGVLAISLLAGGTAFAQDRLLIVDVLDVYKTATGVGTGQVRVEQVTPSPVDYGWSTLHLLLLPSNATVRLTAAPANKVVSGKSFGSFVYKWIGNLPKSWEDRPPIHPATMLLAMNEDKELSILFSRAYQVGEAAGDLDLDGLPDEWELKYELNPEDATKLNGGTGNPSGDEMPGGWTPGTMNQFASGSYPLALTGVNTNWPYRFPVTGVRPPEYYLGAVPFNNWFQARGFDGWYGLNPLTSVNDDPGTDPNLLSTAGDGISDGWKYYFYGSLINDSTPPLEGVALDLASFDPDTSWDIPVLPILRAAMLAEFGLELVVDSSSDPDADCATLLDEFTVGCDPFHWDTDADEMSDGYEIKKGLKPIVSADGNDNPSGDYMAAITVGTTITRRHGQVYADLAFDPRTAWGASYLSRGTARELKPQENTTPFTSREKFKASLYLGFLQGSLSCEDFDAYALDPANIDTDGDGIFDGWELYVGLNPKIKPDPIPDADDDGLNDFMEFSAYDINLTRGATWPNGRTHFDMAWLNKFWPTDPNAKDTDGDGLTDGAEGGYKNLDVEEGEDVSGSLSVLKYAGGTIVWNKSCYVGCGLNATSADTDGDGIPDPWEAVPTHLSKIYSIADEDNRNGMDGTVKDAGRDYDSDGLVNYQEYVSGAIHHWRYSEWTPGLPLGSYDPFAYFTGIPLAWDWHTLINKVPYQYIPKYNDNKKVFYGSTNPRLADTDYDGMDDYWEMYHGLNPLYGTLDLHLSMLMDVKNLAAGVPPTFDIRLQPYIAGSPFADPDQDGLPNSSESIQANVAAPTYYHSDPSPQWVTDPSYQLSWVNLYYGLGMLQAHWYYGSALSPPSYLFSFETDEGFDTDSDMVGDRAELVHTPASPGTTDPLSLETPPRRRALYLDGNAAARTRGRFLHSTYSLTTFTIEAWVRPANPQKGDMQVIMERTMAIPNGNIMGFPEGNRLNFRLALDAAGRPFVAYTGLGYDALYVEAKAPAINVLEANRWYHLAGVYDGTAKRLYLYIDGQMRASVASAERPANGWFTGNPAFVFSAPIVLGAKDNNPDGWVSGTPIMSGIMAGSVLTQPDLSNFFEGWVDEVRIWNGARSTNEIAASRMRKLKIADVVASRTAATTNTASPELLYLYNFDNLLDPSVEGVAPAGFELLNGRPNDGSYPNVPWWGTAADRSTTYDNHLYVPWIANVAARIPLDPPSDSPNNPLMVTVVRTNVTTTTTTSTNSSGDTVTNTVSATNVSSTVEQARSYPNTANPYNFGYYHGASALLEDHPDELNLAHLVFNTRESALFNDLLPLRSARADSSVDMWDGGGTGANPFDSNGDGIPDWWYLQNGFDPLGESVADQDPDGDGVSNYWEYRLGSDPFGMYSLDPSAQLSDAETDSDGDTISNGDEINKWGTDPTNQDTDDDLVRDDVEIMQNTSALYSRSPLVPRSMVMNGVPVAVPEPRKVIVDGGPGPQRFQSLDRWYLGAMVRPAAAQSGSLIRRNVSGGLTHFELGLANNIPFVRFNSPNGGTYAASGANPLPTDRFSSLIAEWNPSNHVLRLLVDDCVVGATNVAAACVLGLGQTVVGDGISGRIDDVFVGRYLYGGGTPSPDYVVMIDVSGSMASDDRIGQAKAAALTMIDAMPNGSSMAIITFDHQIQRVQAFTTDREVLKTVANAIAPLGATSYSAPVTKMLELITDRPAPGGYVGVLISDGLPNSGVPTDADLAQAVALGAKINTVGFGSSILSGSTYELQRIAQNTGGAFYPAPSGAELTQILAVIVSESVSTEDSCFYPFDDGGLHAEDYTQLLNWDYALQGVAFDAAIYSTTATPFNYAFVDSEDELPQWWLDWFLRDSDSTAVSDDPDGDGLSNLNEWRITLMNQAAGNLKALSPALFDSDGNGKGDGDEDHDGDSLIGKNEQATHASRPDRRDTDDDGSDDNQELAAATDPTYSMLPFEMKALSFGSLGGAGNVLIRDRVRGVDTEHLGAKDWTIECYAQPQTVPPIGVDQPLVQRKLRCSEWVNYELGIRNDGKGRILPYVRFNHLNDGNVVTLSSDVAVGLGNWSHVAGRLSDGKLSLFIDGQIVRSMNTSYDPAQGPGDATFGGNGFVGRLKDVRIWKIGRRDTDIRDFRQRSLIFGLPAADPGLLRVSGDKGHLREVAAPGTARDQLREWTLECWVRTTDSQGTILSRVNTGNVVEENDDFNYFLGVDQGGHLVGKFSIQYREVTQNTNGTSTVGSLVFNTSANTLISALPVNDGAWHHVAYTRNLEFAVLYIDGELAGIQNGFLLPGGVASTLQDEDIRILDGPVELGRNLAGDIDEARIWGRALSATEIRSVMKQNLFGSERGLVSYFSFDFQQGIHADDRAAVRNADVEYGTYIPGAQHVRTLDQAPLDEFYPLRVYAFTSLLGYYPADDGGTTVENLLYQNNWDYAGQRIGDAVFETLTEANKPYVDDSDGDGLPDWWETRWGLNPGSDRDADGPDGDPDHDGLSNWAEWLAGTSPLQYDTDGNGTGDYDSNAGGASYGSLYMDGDKIPDTWELLYPSAMSPLRYDDNVDPDGDGWDNLSEYLGSGFTVTTAGVSVALAPTRPDNASSYPVPKINFTFLGNSTANLAAAPLTIWAYSDPKMARPDATTIVPFSNVFANGISATVEQWNVGHLRQGTNFFMAFIDANGDGRWNAGEWMGFSENGSDSIQWGAANVRIALVDKPNGYIRFSWEQDMTAIAAAMAQVNGTTYSVTINSVGSGSNIYTTVRNLESMSRPFITEMDLKQAGVAPLWGQYNWYVSSPGGAVYAKGSNYITYAGTLAAPVFQTPPGTIRHAQEKLKVKLDPATAKIQIVVLSSPGNVSVLDATNFVPYIDKQGYAEISLPALAGWGAFTNGQYNVLIRAFNPVATVYGTWTSFAVDLKSPAQSGAGMISGKAFYFGWAVNAKVVVEAFAGGGFDQTPLAKVHANSNFEYKLMGLPTGDYHVRAFYDYNGNGVLDPGESWGLLKGARGNSTAPAPSIYAVDYSVRRIEIRNSDLFAGNNLVIHDCDVDNDGISDMWEVRYAGNLTSITGTSNMSGDQWRDIDNFRLGRDPRLVYAPPAKAPVLTVGGLVNGGLQIALSYDVAGPTPKVVVVQSTTNLPSGGWKEEFRATINTPGVYSQLVPAASGSGVKFFRIRYEE